MTFCDNFINGDVIYLMSKHVFSIKEQLCQSFWQFVKAFRFEAKKIEEGGCPFDPPHTKEISTVKCKLNDTENCSFCQKSKES